MMHIELGETGVECSLGVFIKLSSMHNKSSLSVLITAIKFPEIPLALMTL